MGSIIIGKTLLNQYRVDQFIASGGMGSVYRVWDLNRQVALAMKVLHSDLAEDPAMFDRFKQEARKLEKLSHPNIIPFYGIEETRDMVVMFEQFIDGPTLKDTMKDKKGQILSEGEAFIFLKSICSALGFAHHNNIIHCDVKAANVMVDHGGRIFLGDFGIARHTNSTTSTMAGAGSPAYMAPEQILSHPVTPATDIYALGILLFEMLTGQRPFKGTEKGAEKGGPTLNERTRYAHLYLSPPNPRYLNPKINQQLEIVILRALEKNPSRRFQSCQDFFDAVCQSIGVHPDKVSNRIKLTTEPIQEIDYDQSKEPFQSITSSDQPNSDPQSFLYNNSDRTRERSLLFFGGLMAVILITGLTIGGYSLMSAIKKGTTTSTISPAVTASLTPQPVVQPTATVVVVVPVTVPPTTTPGPDTGIISTQTSSLTPTPDPGKTCVYQMQVGDSIWIVINEIYQLEYDDLTTYFIFSECDLETNSCTLPKIPLVGNRKLWEGDLLIVPGVEANYCISKEHGYWVNVYP